MFAVGKVGGDWREIERKLRKKRKGSFSKRDNLYWRKLDGLADRLADRDHDVGDLCWGFVRIQVQLRVLGVAAWNILFWACLSQASLTQGVIFFLRAGFWQWHLKSVRPEQPSEVKASVKQLSCKV